jgi:hypothetical protein
LDSITNLRSQESGVRSQEKEERRKKERRRKERRRKERRRKERRRKERRRKERRRKIFCPMAFTGNINISFKCIPLYNH